MKETKKIRLLLLTSILVLAFDIQPLKSNDLPDLGSAGPLHSGCTPSPIYYGDYFHVWCKIKNFGSASADSFRVAYYASSDSNITPDDHLLGTDYIAFGVQPDQMVPSDWSGAWRAAGPGGYRIGWIIDSEDNVVESNENNNVARLYHAGISISDGDEYFRTVDPCVYDIDDDGYNDSVKIFIMVQSKNGGGIDATVKGYLTYYGSIIDYEEKTFPTSSGLGGCLLRLTVPCDGFQSDRYRVSLDLYDQWGRTEDDSAFYVNTLLFPRSAVSLKIETNGNGITDPNVGTHLYACDSSEEVTAIADANYAFDYWSLDGNNAGTDNPYSILMDDDHELQAVFSLDDDGDGIPDNRDNCPLVYNPDQNDNDDDGLGDLCDDDDDNDDLPDTEDNCPYVHNPQQEDFDEDEVGDLCDNCPDVYNQKQKDSDGDRIGDICECDTANIDGVNPVDFIDFCIFAADCFLEGPELSADTNRDQSVDYLDLENIAQHWLEHCTPPCIDRDEDGYGDPANPSCPYPELDCNDTDPNINPGAAEICNDGIDNDCDGLIDCNDTDCEDDANCPWPTCWYGSTQCHGDADGDGYVERSDMLILIRAFGSSPPEPNYDPCADFSRDFAVEGTDLMELLYWFEQYPPADCDFPPGGISWPGCWNSPTQCYGDANWDGIVDESDQSLLENSWKTCYGHDNYNPCADFDRDGTVYMGDFSILVTWWKLNPPNECEPESLWPPVGLPHWCGQ